MRLSGTVFAIVLATLVGCVTTQDQTVEATRNQAKAICSYLPTAGTIVDILGLGLAPLGTAKQVATAICDAVAGETAGGGQPMVEGVPVRGEFVKE